MKKSKRSYRNMILKKHLTIINPYQPSPNLGYNICDAVRYAKKHNLAVQDLTEEQMKQFATK